VLRDRHGGRGSGNVRGMTGDRMVKPVCLGDRSYVWVSYKFPCHKITTERQPILLSPNLPIPLPLVIVPPPFRQTYLGNPSMCLIFSFVIRMCISLGCCKIAGDESGTGEAVAGLRVNW
jgi:hypothetical protein